MKNSIANYVASSMDSALKSQEFQSLFKSASADSSKVEAEKEHEHTDECDCDDSQKASDKEEGHVSNAFEVAVDSLLTASGALEALGMEKGSALSLKLASLVVEAKKKETAEKKVSKEMKKQDKELDKTRLKEKKDSETKKNKELEKDVKVKVQKGKDHARSVAKKEKAKKDKFSDFRYSSKK